MYEIDYLAVGEGMRSGDAICLRFTRSDNGQLARMVIDGGFQPNGQELVDLFIEQYQTSQADLVVCTHPDGDHIGGLGTVIRQLDVDALLIHRPSLHGDSSSEASNAVEELVSLAGSLGIAVYEPFQGLKAFGDTLVVAGPSEEFYKQLLAEQLTEAAKTTKALAEAAPGRLSAGLARLGARVLSAFPVEVPFGDAGGTNARNNTSVILDLQVDGSRLLFTGDAGVRALDPALDYLGSIGRDLEPPGSFHVPHHGSRHNLDSATQTRLFGPPGQDQTRSAFISISEQRAADPRYPSPRVTNGLGRRGYVVCETAGNPSIWHISPDAPRRQGYPLTPIPPRDESIDDRE